MVGIIIIVEGLDDDYTVSGIHTGDNGEVNCPGTQVIHESALELIVTEPATKLSKNVIKWLEALRSGKYKQAKGVLKSSDGGYCCLGVVCELYRKTRKKGFIHWDDEGFFHVGDRNSRLTLPVPVMNWLGLNSHRGEVTSTNCLPAYNDEGKTFAEMADIIEQNAGVLFGKKAK